ncbi:PD-(D/E)XK nuclease family protein [Marisediminicola sp. LYQ134]|uniref:PD-(D/E)XK nuclease family protein n=1 Tax=Marisediminicola sp. LYQ134 TaxID=3391061 RepID=UPI0039834C13
MSIPSELQRAASSAPVDLDESQRAVVDLGDDVSAAVLGAPGSGKTTTLVEVVAQRVLDRGWGADRVLALTTSRLTATRLRDRLAARLAVPTDGPLARSATSLAFEIVSAAAERDGAEPLRLVTGGEQDSDFAGLLAGHVDERAGSPAADPHALGPTWPEHISPRVRQTTGFRTELRELYMRSTEFGVGPARLRELGRATDRAEWVASADFFAEYDDVVSLSRPGQIDAADLMRRAAQLIDDDALSARLGAVRLVVVDDLQEATESVFTLLRALAARGVAVIAFGDPDVAANSFRGGEPRSLGLLSTVLGLPALETLTLSTAHRQGTELRAFTSAIVSRIGTAAAGRQRAAVAGGSSAQTPVVRIEAPTASRHLAAIARVLREHHLVGGVPFNDMVVVARSGSHVPALARALALAEVPTRTSVGGRALRDDRAARSLLAVVDVGLRRTPLTVDRAESLLLSPFGGLDALGLRRLRLALRAEEIAGGGSRLGGELLVDALGNPGRFATIDHRVARRAERMSATLAAVSAAATAGSTIEELLWLVWERSGLADEWRRLALGAGISAAEANRDLDGVVSLFTAAKRFVEREPSSPPGGFLDAVLNAAVPEDTLSPQALGDAVLVVTPSALVGLEFEVVVIASLHDGVWPNLRLRGSLLHTGELVDLVTGVDSSIVEPRKQVLSDELRMFALAVSRARSQVVLAAVASDDEGPSVFFSLLPPDLPVTDGSTLAPLSLRGLTGRLRRELALERRPESELGHAASALALLAREGVSGAAPDEWHGLLGVSTTTPIYVDDETVPVSPSQLESVEASPLDWFVERVAGSTTSPTMGMGTIVHWAMETATDESVDGLFAAIESRWGELVFESPWVSAHQRVVARRLAAGVAEYLSDFRRAGGALVDAESRFTLEVGRALVSGSIDRVERTSDGAVVIVDLKTGRPVTKAEVIADHAQLQAYQLAYAEGRLDDALASLGEHRGGGAKLLFVKEGVRGKLYREAVQAPLSDEELAGFRARIETAATLMAAAEFRGTVEVTGWGGSGSVSKLHRVRAVSSD